MYWVLWLLFYLCLILAVAFSTLLERKLLALTQNRIAPNKTVYAGILQPVLDGIKLLLKSKLQLEFKSTFIYQMSSMASLMIMLLLILVLPYSLFVNNYYIVFYLLIILGLNSSLMLISGWSSMNKYSKMGSIRNLSLMVSFEIMLTFMIFLPFLLNKSFNLTSYWSFSILPLMSMWILIFLMENNRSPFDLSEGESELVSGFNTEYMGLLFTFFFLAEYGNTIISASLTYTVFFTFNFFLIYFIILFLLMRAPYPRLKFSDIMSLTWMSFLPVTFMIWVFFIQMVDL